MESTKENRVWHKGPPPHVGWWNASVRRFSEFWRWWDGVAWSAGAHLRSSAELAADCATMTNSRTDVEWNDYWPADARVPRLAPEDFEVGARWVCVKPSAVAFVGEEVLVRDWHPTGLHLGNDVLRLHLKPDELPSEHFVPRRCVGPQTRWDFPVMRADRYLETVLNTVRGTSIIGEVLKASRRKDHLHSQLVLPNPRDVAHARVLEAQGYRRISNAYGMVARIDRPDWVDVLAKELRRAPADFYVPGQSEPAGNWCDHYRRSSHCKDKLEINKAVAKLVPTSGHNNVGYVPPFKVEIR